MINEKEKWQDAIRYIRNMIFEYLLGLGTAACIFILAVWGFLERNRTGIKTDYHLFYSFQEICTMLKNIFLPSYSTEQELAVCTIGIIIVISIILSKNNGKEKVALFLLFLLTSIAFLN